MVLPIFTFEGKGIDNKRDKSRYCSLRDSKDPDSPDGEGPWPPIFMERAKVLNQGSGEPGRNMYVL
jgi:hypothetical protein